MDPLSPLAFGIPNPVMQQQAFRITLLVLLALMQLFAPLVHAHVGSAEVYGKIHVPGLEFLGRVQQHSAQSFEQKGALDVIVGLAKGLRNHRHDAKSQPNPDIDIPALITVSEILPLAPSVFIHLPLVRLSSAFWSAFAPRAPPAKGWLHFNR